MAIIHIIERILKKAIWEVQIPVLMISFGIKVKVFRIPTNDMYHSVYGIAAGANEGVDRAVEVGDITAIIVGDEWTAADLGHVGTFSLGWMYCIISDMYGPGGNVISFASNGAGGTRVTTGAPHGLLNNDKVFIIDNENYNGFYTISSPTVSTFDIPKPFTVTGTARWATTKIKEGDTVRFSDRQDTKIRRYKVEKLESIGSTIEIIQRFRLSSLGD